MKKETWSLIALRELLPVKYFLKQQKKQGMVKIVLKASKRTIAKGTIEDMMRFAKFLCGKRSQASHHANEFSLLE